MDLRYSNRARRAFRRLPPRINAQIRARLREIAADPFARHAGVMRLQGVENGFRLRIGDWRALYVVNEAEATVDVEDIAPRGQVYRR